MILILIATVISTIMDQLLIVDEETMLIIRGELYQ
jgi:hypothetical protein